MEKKKTKKRISILVLLVLLLALCGTSGFIFYDKVLNKKEEGTTVEKQEKEDNKPVALAENDVLGYLNKMEYVNERFSDMLPIQDTRTLDNKDVFLRIFHDVRNNLNFNFTEAEFKEHLSSLFGYDYPFVNSDVDCPAGDGILYHYDSEKKEYIFQGTHGHDGTGFSNNKVYFQDASVDNEKGVMTIHAKVVLLARCGGVCGPISTYYTIGNKEPIFEAKDPENTTIDDVYKEVSSTLPIVTYTFVRNSDYNYGLKSITVE